MTKAECKAAKERCEKATKGPWTDDVYYIVAEVSGGRPGGETIGEFYREAVDRIRLPNLANVAFATHARTDLPAALEHIEDDQAALERITELLDAGEVQRAYEAAVARRREWEERK